MSLPLSKRRRPSRNFSFMKLTPELRQMIYIFCFGDRDHERVHDRVAPLDAAYLHGVQSAGTDQSLSLLRLNKQLFGEVTAKLRRLSLRITMRVTAQKAWRSKTSPSSLVRIQGNKERCEKRTEYLLEIWPPHPDRPVEAFFIWDHLCLFRERRKEVHSPYTIMLRYIDNLLFVWAPNGRPSHNLPSLLYNPWTQSRSDMETIGDFSPQGSMPRSLISPCPSPIQMVALMHSPRAFASIKSRMSSRSTTGWTRI